MRNLHRYLLAVVLSVGVVAPWPRPAQAGGPDGVVGNGNPASCTAAEVTLELSVAGPVTFACGASPYIIILTTAGGILPGAGSHTLDGGGLITLSAANVTDRRLFDVPPTAALTLTRLTLTNASMVSAGGGALLNRGRLVLDTIVAHHISVQGTFYGGGAVHNEAGSLLVRNSLFQENYSAGGGAIFVNPGTHATIEGSTFLSNTVPNGAFGGAISNHGHLTITASSFTGNQVTLLSPCPGSVDNQCGGGAVANFASGVLSVTTTLFSRNSSDELGGAIFNRGNLGLRDVTLSSNTAGLHGGAVANGQAPAVLVMTRVVIAGNQAYAGGGLLNLFGGHAQLSDVTFENNTATNFGGGLANVTAGAVLTGVTFSGNLATQTGGAIQNQDGSDLRLTNATFDDNGAGMTGGALSNDSGSTVRLTHVTLSDNLAGGGPGSAGGIAHTSGVNGDAILRNVLLVANSPRNCAGQALDGPLSSLSTDNTCFSPSKLEGNQFEPALVLGPLANNGGFTRTRLPAVGSSAIDLGSCTTSPVVDQRGLPRPVGPFCDIGAVERQAVDYGWYVFLPSALR